MLGRLLLHVLAAGHAASGVFALQGPVDTLTKRIVPRSHVIHERQPDHWASQWVKREKVAADSLLPMRIGLKQFNLADGHEKLMDM